MFRNQFLQQKPTIIRKKRDVAWSSIKVYQSLILSRRKPNFGCGRWYRTSGRGEEARMKSQDEIPRGETRGICRLWPRVRVRNIPDP